jgi:hypothetical protein
MFQAGETILPVSGIKHIDTGLLVTHGRVTVIHAYRPMPYELTEVESIELLMLVCPAALEGRRLKWLRHAWAVHNLVGHPLMQALSWLGLPKVGLHVHNNTIPRPQVHRDDL